jgi:sulfur relay (sulfurtransferase) DsrC/TusE family protein
LKLNPLQSETEKNVQRGIEQILRGIYIGIRNPRSHEQAEDTREDADAIIHFLDFLLRQLNASQAAFSIESFQQRIQDPEFVESSRYAELLVSEIPRLKLADAAISIFRTRKKVELKRLRYLVPMLLGKLDTNQLARYLDVVSEEFRTATDEFTIRTGLQLLTPDVWPQLAELPRLRIENKLINGLRSGEVLPSGKTISPLATWANNFLKAFSTRSEALGVLLAKLEGTSATERHFVARFFLHYLHELPTKPYEINRAIRAIVAAVQNDDENVTEQLISAVHNYPEEWQKKLAEELKEKTDEENPGTYLNDGTPFLASASKAEFDDDIPF